VTVLERVNVRALDAADLPYRPDLVVADLSFISLRKVLPALLACAADEFDCLALVKPQFELRLARPPSDARRLALAVASATEGFAACGWTALGVMESPARGARGALEYLLHARRTAHQGFRAGRSGP
jgi:23S rRNA (cytidine1920-2'-O)/16S rRNA (cytidine1409-2'-O)-methyltransferase